MLCTGGSRGNGWGAELEDRYQYAAPCMPTGRDRNRGDLIKSTFKDCGLVDRRGMAAFVIRLIT